MAGVNQKWGWYGVLYKIAKGDPRAFESISLEPFTKILIQMCYESDIATVEKKIMKNAK